MVRRIATLVVLIGLTGFAAPRSFSQGQAAAQEKREKAERDVPGQLRNARFALENAKKEMERAGDEWGGHRVAAINHVNAALEEITKAEEYAKEHKLIK
jgi:hypothetical protein